MPADIRCNAGELCPFRGISNLGGETTGVFAGLKANSPFSPRPDFTSPELGDWLGGWPSTTARGLMDIRYCDLGVGIQSRLFEQPGTDSLFVRVYVESRQRMALNHYLLRLEHATVPGTLSRQPRFRDSDHALVHGFSFQVQCSAGRSPVGDLESMASYLRTDPRIWRSPPSSALLAMYRSD